MNPIVQAEGLSKVYGDPKNSSSVVALAEATLDLWPGEVVSVMGPSGSGKTTLLSILGCILRPSAGELQIDGNRITEMTESQLPAIRRKYIGFVFQSYNLFKALTVAENIELALRLKEVPESQIAKEASRLMEMVGLSHRRNHVPSDLSGGEKQRVAIARALGGNPLFVLADEPTANLDSKNGGEILRIFESLAQDQGKAVVVVTHDPRINKIRHRPLNIEDGRIQEVAHVA
ncbi:MAG TPA: ABC transporter ATP-binding protein [Acidobacteriota bacterium]|nr:ABC transporter ATP-binding protein [Acidobacteriota bacterium]